MGASSGYHVMKTGALLIAAIPILGVVSAEAQVTRVRATTQSFVFPQTGVVTALGPWREEVDPSNWFDGLTDTVCIRPNVTGEFLIGASIQWSLQTPDPQRGVRELQFYRFRSGATPLLLDAIAMPPVQDYVTKQSAATQVSLVAGDCVIVAAYHTAGVPVAVVGTRFWVERLASTSSYTWPVLRLRKQSAPEP